MFDSRIFLSIQQRFSFGSQSGTTLEGIFEQFHQDQLNAFYKSSDKTVVFVVKISKQKVKKERQNEISNW